MSFDSFIDSRQIESGAEIDTDLCIIGAGVAGITVAREFRQRGLGVCVLEGGGLSVHPDVTRLGQIESVGRQYPVEDCRLRFFGGTANHWGGHCAPLEPIDFERLDWIEHSGWPYPFDELLPYYQRAHEVVRLGEFDYDATAISDALGMATFPFDPQLVQTVVSRYNPLRFGLTYGDELDRADNISVYLYADVSAINLRNEARDVSSVTVKSVAGNVFAVRARQFVLATGGIENARLLLLSNKQRTAGLGNHSDLVGRFFQEHLWYTSGAIVAKPGHDLLRFYGSQIPYSGIQVRGHIALPEQQVRNLRIPRFRSEIAFVSNVELASRRIRRGEISIEDVLTLLGRSVDVSRKLFSDEWPEPESYRLDSFVQQVPNWNSRVTLSSNRDALGRPLSKLDWRLLPIDQEGILKSHHLIAREVGRSELGRMYIALSEDDEQILDGVKGGRHHMGTTRMDDDPKRGVTDGNGRVHFIENLYVAGSSLFPTCGWANPTLTIVATSLRLADHLDQKLKGGG